MTDISDEAPIRLKDAVKIAFPAGGMTVSGLRREHANGRLNLELIAGKQFVTLRAIAKMRELCRVPAKPNVNVGSLISPTERPSAEGRGSILAKLDVRRNGPLSIRERLGSDCAAADKLNKARPISKRERDALKLCFEARGTSIALDTHWPRTALWLVLRGLIQATGHNNDGERIYRITPEGEAAWLAMSDGKSPKS